MNNIQEQIDTAKIDTKTLLSIVVGTVLEWYDFSLFASMAPLIAILFFPSKIHSLSLLAAFGVFASGFIMRPIGGIIFGHIGDRYGRRSALSLTIILMAVPTTLIGLLPTFQIAGFIAPIALIVCRLVQGIASSGEYPGAICFLTEMSSCHKRGFWGSISMFGVIGGLLLGSIINAVISATLSEEQMYSWGWRLPFLIGLPLGMVGCLIRYKVRESEIFKLTQLTNNVLKQPIIQVLKSNFLNVMIVTTLFSLSTIYFYMNFVYIITYLVSEHKITFNESLLSNIVSTTTLILLIPVFGYLSDKTSRKYLMFGGVILLLLFSYPIFRLLLLGDPYGLLLGQVLAAFCLSMFVGPMAAAVAEIFSTSMRYSGVSLGLNLGASIFGGTCPLIATFMVQHTGSAVLPIFYPIIVALICLLAIICLENNQKVSLNKV